MNSLPSALRAQARLALDACQTHTLRLATAESCTGGLIAAALTDWPGSSASVERGFVTYSNEAKTDMLDVPVALIVEYGAVSEAVARAMAEGALVHSKAEVSLAVTGVAGPSGGSADKPVGTVHMAAARLGRATLHRQHLFAGDRDQVRLAAALAALGLLIEQIEDRVPQH